MTAADDWRRQVLKALITLGGQGRHLTRVREALRILAGIEDKARSNPGLSSAHAAILDWIGLYRFSLSRGDLRLKLLNRAELGELSVALITMAMAVCGMLASEGES